MTENGQAVEPHTVLIVAHTATLGGAELALVRLVGAVDPDRFRVVVALFESGPLVDRLNALDIETRIVPWSDADLGSVSRSEVAKLGTLARAASGGVGLARAMHRLVRELRPAVVHSWTLKAHLVMTPLAPLMGPPLVWSLHDRLTPEYLGRAQSIVLRSLARVPKRVLANSAATGSTAGRRSDVVYPGLPKDAFVREVMVRDSRVTARPTFLLLGRLSPTKGQDVAIRAMAEVVEVHPDARLRVVGEAMFGEDDYVVECRRLADALGLGGSVEFVGHVADPRDELDGATALVHASPMPEPFGQVLTEAMARRVPVIATDAGGVPEILSAGTGALGLLVRPGDSRDLAQAMNSVIADPAGAADRAERAHRVAAERFTIEATAATTQDIWEAVSRASSRPS